MRNLPWRHITILILFLGLSEPTYAAESQLNIGATTVIAYGDVSKPPFSNGEETFQKTSVRLTFSHQASDWLKSGFDIKIESEGSSMIFDEAHLFLEGRWGLLEIGDEDGASDALAVFAPVNAGSGHIDGRWDRFIEGRGRDVIPNYIFKTIDSQDSTKISYYTPSLSPIQVGISYAPEGPRESQENAGHTVLHSDAVERLKEFIEVGAVYRKDFDRWETRTAFTASRFVFVKGGQESTFSWQLGTQWRYRIPQSPEREERLVTIGGGYVDFGRFETARADRHYDYGYNVGIEYEDGPVILDLGYARIEGYSHDVKTIGHLIGLGWTYYLTPFLSWEIDFVSYKVAARSFDTAVFGVDLSSGSLTAGQGRILVVGLNASF